MENTFDRIVQTELEELIRSVPAVAVEGPRGVGKTFLADRISRTRYDLDISTHRELLDADPERLDREPTPILLDEWQRMPEVWDWVRRSVDRDPSPGRFILTGSAAPENKPTHSGAGRIVTVRMHALSLAERRISQPTVQLADLLSGNQPAIEGETGLTLKDYLHELAASGFPAIRQTSKRSTRALLDGYLERIVEHDVPEQGLRVKQPRRLEAWLRAYAAAISTNTAYNRILDAATSGDGTKPARKSTEAYRDILEQLWLLDPLPAWIPSENRLNRLSAAPKHHLTDPALAMRLLNLTPEGMNHPQRSNRNALHAETLTSRLFESLVVQSLRVYAQANEASTFHFRTHGGDREIDAIVEADNGQVVAFEVKLGRSVKNDDVAHLHWLKSVIQDDLLDAIVVTSGQTAYRRRDGIGVVPAALLTS
jgi:predicted AAA+ superfamily ATPase